MRQAQHRSHFGSAASIEKLLALKTEYSDARHPAVRTRSKTGGKALFVNGITTHLTNFHMPGKVRYSQDFTPGAANLLLHLISLAAMPEYQVRQ